MPYGIIILFDMFCKYPPICYSYVTDILHLHYMQQILLHFGNILRLISMFCIDGLDNHIKGNYNMSATNHKNIKIP